MFIPYLSHMFTVVYSFKVHPGMHVNFETAWKRLTEFIYEYEGSLGSRLHTPKENEYIAYAQWPDRDTWVNSGNKLPEEAQPFRQTMRECCESIDTLHELEVQIDLLKTETYKG